MDNLLLEFSRDDNTSYEKYVDRLCNSENLPVGSNHVSHGPRSLSCTSRVTKNDSDRIARAYELSNENTEYERYVDAICKSISYKGLASSSVLLSSVEQSYNWLINEPVVDLNRKYEDYLKMCSDASSGVKAQEYSQYLRTCSGVPTGLKAKL